MNSERFSEIMISALQYSNSAISFNDADQLSNMNEMAMEVIRLRQALKDIVAADKYESKEGLILIAKLALKD